MRSVATLLCIWLAALGGSGHGRTLQRARRLLDAQLIDISFAKFVVFIEHVLVPQGDARKSCNGALIAHSWVLTAAHSIDFGRAADMLVYANVSKSDDGAVVVGGVQNKYVHRQFNHSSPAYDIGLLHLTEPLYGVNIAPIRRRRWRPKIYQACTVYSYSFEHLLFTSFGQLKTKHFQIMMNSMCNQMCETLYMTNTMMCAYMGGTEESILNDVGSPIVYNGLLAGIITSYCQPAYQPAITIITGIHNLYTDIKNMVRYPLMPPYRRAFH